MFPDCLPVSSDRQNIFSPVSTSIQLEHCLLHVSKLSLYASTHNLRWFCLCLFYHTLCSQDGTSFHSLLTTMGTSVHLSISHCTRVLLHYYALLSEFRNSLPCVLLKLPLSLAHSLLIRKWSILQTEIIQAWSVKKRERIISHICSLSHAHCKDCTSCFNRLTC